MLDLTEFWFDIQNDMKNKENAGKVWEILGEINTDVIITDEKGNEIGDMPEKRKKAKEELIKIGEDKIAKKYIF